MVQLGNVPWLRYRWSGREYDAETGFYFNRARYYDPAVGRFVQEDPTGNGGGENLYAYASGNPLERRDPSGTAWAYEAYAPDPNDAKFLGNCFTSACNGDWGGGGWDGGWSFISDGSGGGEWMPPGMNAAAASLFANSVLFGSYLLYKKAFAESQHALIEEAYARGADNEAGAIALGSSRLSFQQFRDGVQAINAIHAAESPNSAASVILKAFLSAGRIFLNEFVVHQFGKPSASATYRPLGYIALTSATFRGGSSWSERNSLPTILLHESAHVYLFQRSGIISEDAAYGLACQWVPISVGNCSR